MSKLTREEVINTLQSALEKQKSSPVVIEQKGGWYKIDGGKSIRFSELETMLQAINAVKPTQQPAAVQATPATDKTVNTKAGLKPKELWRQKLAIKGATLPRGC
ncbi:hypothetical protein NFHSH190041_21470 [Shewanella sp. NFH-SH190041]|uniref:hypothetical protein n=1 Tax=Shewanella sp. NFH-SH190041 TaxID=2950245 RepID=UPI0021C391BE|nr:hypothetical protein [Shewanella sp. NFH-SH190041]BDM64695.1 hypothetical protein NFHSH190041_21470 [Shewanella sp. NFH-SH190041]